MAQFTFPRSEADQPDSLLALLGSYWTELHPDDALARSVLHARAQLDQQAQEDLGQLTASLSRYKTKPYRLRNYTPIRLLASERNLTDRNLPRYDGEHLYAEAFTARYGVTQSTEFSCWTLPTEIASAPVILNRISGGSVTWVSGVDYLIENGVLMLRTDPFASEHFVQQDVYEGNVIVDKAIQLWLYRAEFDERQIYLQYGYVIGPELPSGSRYRDFVNAIYDGIVEGTNRRAVENAFSALCDVDLAVGDETVLYDLRDNNHRVIVTDKRAYRFHRDAVVLVGTGDVLQAGQAIVDSVRFFEFNRGQVPAAEDIRALAIGKGVLVGGYWQDLVFENKTVPLSVIPDIDGYTYLEFEIDGAPGDVEKFWHDLHSAGITKNQTLAMLLDTRANPVEQPLAMNLPSTINPFGFLCRHVLRHHAFIVKLRPDRFGSHALGLSQIRQLRKLVPPHTLMIVMVELALTGDAIIMDGPGDETRPGYTETLGTFAGAAVSETIRPVDYITERLRAVSLQGYCE